MKVLSLPAKELIWSYHLFYIMLIVQERVLVYSNPHLRERPEMILCRV